MGPRGRQRPVIVVELEGRRGRIDGELRALAAGNPLTAVIETFLYHPSFPVDARHNIKIDRLALQSLFARQPDRNL